MTAALRRDSIVYSINKNVNYLQIDLQCLLHGFKLGSRCRVQTAGGVSCRKWEMLNHSPYGSAPHQSRIFPTPAELEWQELSVRDTATHLHGLWAHQSRHNSNYDRKLPK